MGYGSPHLYRFCIHLPTLYNDKRQIEGTKIDAMLNELQVRFKGYTKSPHDSPIYDGYYLGDDDKIYHDKLFLMYIDAPEEGKAVAFFQEFKEKYEKILEQREIYIVYYRITQIVTRSRDLD